MKNIILTIFFLSFFQIESIFAQTSEDTIVKVNYHLSKKEFLDLYVEDDTSRALIEIYFKKRDVAGAFLGVYGVFLTGELLIVHAMLLQEPSLIGTAVVLTGLAYTVLVFFPSTAFLVEGIVNLNTYSKKNLHNNLIKYLRGNGLSKPLKKRVVKYLSHSQTNK